MRKHPITGNKQMHTGIDMVKSHRAPIFAFVAGKVTWAKFGTKGSGYGNYGNVVAIKDLQGYTHVYAHLDSICVQEGEFVEVGQKIGRQGATGQVTGSHLHYEIRRQGWGTHVDPSKYLAAQENKPPLRLLINDKEIGVPMENIDGKVYISVPGKNGFVQVVARELGTLLGGQVGWELKGKNTISIDFEKEVLTK
jgi:hypothetical protein